MKTWLPLTVTVENEQVTIIDADASFEVVVEYECGPTDADGRKCGPDGNYVESADLLSININGKERSRLWLVDICGEDAVSDAEEWARDTFDADEISAAAGQDAEDAKADYFEHQYAAE